jgi:serine/threonine-protein kinase
MTQPSADFLELQAALAGEYSLERELGRGGMGVVYLAREVQLDRDVAIKVLPAQLAMNGTARERFMREARTAAGLSHPNIVPIHRVGQAGDFVFFVMSYVDGETLGERLRSRGPLPPVEATRILREVAWALAFAHGRGIVHRDIKPDNILLERASGRALVTDFGIAQRDEYAGMDTDPGKVMGTAYFMSPEQAANEPVDGRSDLYALGVVGYLSVSGRLPFEATNLPALLVRQASEPAPGVALAAPGIPNALSRAIDQCLARDPDARPADGESLAAALAPASENRPALPTTLRNWLGARNPLLVPYMAWSGFFGVLTTGNVVAYVTGNRPDGPADIFLLAAIASAPLVPVFGFHLNQARRQFRAGHSLADLRTALEVGQRERAESESLARTDEETMSHRLLRIATVAVSTWLGVTFILMLQGVIHENRTPIIWFLAPLGGTLLLGAASNALEVRFIPDRLRNWWQSGIRSRLWNSRIGEWFAKRLGAPERPRAVGGGAFRATEVALGAAVADLYAALPQPFREQLGDLPVIVEALEARAAEARAEVEMLAALAPSGGSDAAVLQQRCDAAGAHLADSVAALEGIRLDLLRLHAGGGDLSPLTTLMDAARALGDDARRLAEAQREVDEATGREPGVRQIATPA